MVNEKIRVKVVCPTVTTEDILTVALSSFGVDVGNVKKSTPVIVSKFASAGTGKAEDDKVSISGTNLIINEGSTGFVTGDYWFIDFVLGEIPSVAATAS